MKFYSLHISDIRQETPECVSIAFEVPKDLQSEFQYRQGQHLTVRMQMNGEEVRRSYSLCSSPLEEGWRIAVKKVEGGVFSTFANEQLKKGDLLEVAAPDGRFFPENLDIKAGDHVVLFAAGSGITPVISIIKSLLVSNPDCQISLIYGNKNAASVIFLEEIEGLKNRYLGRFQVFHVLSRARTDVDWQRGRIDQERLQLIFKKMPDLLEGNHYFICGPEEMLLSVRESLEKNGISKSNIHFELFGTGKVGEKKKAAVVSENIVAQAEIRLDGLRFDVPIHGGEVVLDAALAAGADLPFACKGGVCCTCRAKLVEGEVDMEVNYALDPEEVEAGFILTCQATPKTKSLKIDFDTK
ncbi:MAG: phenylacetate-CoA oxygenase/reductase subunit PaaK [Lewinellaceae bacterium]|nr:phenylacetate-CoA oxygenase/reductase subunit PaaK [Saprospiraceae bacterium]MCB9343759.1 phenylacetate-CoA oxygenase/reductase subunit PaaK [Lewinellaceae bacterium]